MRRSHTALVAAGVGTGSLIAAALVWQASSSSFTATTTNGSNVWTAGQVTLTTGTASALFASVGPLKPSDTGQQCITVTYSGNVLANVHFYVTSVTGATMAAALLMTVERVDGSVACASFSSSTITTLYTSTALSSLPTTFATGTAGTWSASSSTTKTYRFTYVLDPNAANSVQNTTTSATLDWEADT